MRKRLLGIMVLSVITFLFVLGMNWAWAKYPERKIKLICAWAVGGGTDVMARALTRYANPYLDGRVYVENVTGGTGMIAMEEILSAAPDGYTIKMITTTNTIAPNFMKDFPSIERLDPICVAATDPMVLAVSPESRFKKIDDLLSAAKENPGKLNCGTAGPTSATHLAAVALGAATGTHYSYVPFKGDAPAILAVAGKHVDFAIGSGSEAFHLWEAKKIRILISLGAQRSRLYPDVPTAKELGHEVLMFRWMGVGAPKGLPKEVKGTLADAFRKAMKHEEFKKFIDQTGQELVNLGPEESAAWIKSQIDYFKSVANRAGIKPE